jgi:hypothetical protein
MDFDIGNILYVLITLVAIIASLLGKKKKSDGKKAKPGFFENLEQVLKMGQEDPALADLKDHEPDLPEEEIVYEDVKEDPVFNTQTSSLMEEYERSQSVRDSSLAESGKLEVERSTVTTEYFTSEEEEEEELGFLEILKDFDAGSAVVYSAIINRPNY